MSATALCRSGHRPAFMELSRQFILVFTFIVGPLVLISYAYGVSRLDKPSDLWGGVPESWRTYIIPFMFAAAIGFLMYWYVVFFQFDESTVESLRWPWGESDGNGTNRLFLALALFLIPSALWIESTIFHVGNEYSWTPALVVGILVLVSVGNVMLGLLAYGAYQDGVSGSGLMLVGSILLAIQCILNDLIVWVYKFPW